MRLQGFGGSAAEGTVGVDLEDSLQVAAGAGFLAQGGEAEPCCSRRCQAWDRAYGPIRSFKGGAGFPEASRLAPRAE